MLDWISSRLNINLNDENRFGWSVTGILHLLLIIIAIFYTIHMDADERPAYIEVTLGEFQTGTVAEQAQEEPEEVATRPNPAEEQPEEPEPELEEPEETPEQEPEEVARPVDLTEQIEEIDADVIETPDTEEIDPEVQHEEQQEQIESPPQAQEDEQIEEGEDTSGHEEGTVGEMNVEHGSGTDEELSSPYDLRWEGDLDRSPMVQPLPENTEDVEAVITVRFQVFPDGSVGQVIPLRKMNPELERQVMSTLRTWRFSRLPSGVPQEPQWGTITFRFILD